MTSIQPQRNAMTTPLHNPVQSGSVRFASKANAASESATDASPKPVSPKAKWLMPAFFNYWIPRTQFIDRMVAFFPNLDLGEKSF